jgi:hypothetical protein
LDLADVAHVSVDVMLLAYSRVAAAYLHRCTVDNAVLAVLEPAD